ncbi:hypothetical protein BT96DRAFT_1001429 [Gymnopus androsaceus JB14]|uniref:Uncharacterized protein n=1 Tax=Gymnopus androsaceus JB14 TaxID=1447944 RepID=A0A6A4GZH6_9AGAR|nr:hypothetical protein BT96DRAFT_1001429 [Gymnopus androsaceus JB14]
MARLNSRSYNSYCQPPSFFTSLEEAIQHVARPNNPLSPSADRVGPPGCRRIVKLSTFQSSPTRSDGRVSPLGVSYEPRAPGSQSSPRKLGTTVLPSAAPPPSTLPPHGVRIVRGPTIRIPPPVRPVPSDCPQAPSVPLRVGDMIIPPGSDLARELEAFKATEAQNAAASKARFFKDQEDACLAAAETKRRLELEQQRKGKRAVKANWEEDLREQEWKEKKARRHKRGLDAQQRQQQHAGSSTLHAISPRPVPTIPVVFPGGQGLPPTLSPLLARFPAAPAAAPTTAPSPASPSVPPEHSSTFSPWAVPPVPLAALDRPGLDGAAYSRAHLDITSSRDPAMKDLWDAYGDSQRLNPIHPVHWEPLPPMPVLRTNDVGALQQELSDMQRHLNSSQLDLETERTRNRMAVIQTGIWKTQLADLRRLNSEQERMLKNCQVEYELLEGEVRALADSAAASTASAARPRLTRLWILAARIEDLEGILACYEVELRKSEEGRGVAVDRAICREVEIGNTSQLIHDLLGTCEHLCQCARSAEDSASSLHEGNLDLVAQLGGSYSLEVASKNNALLRAEVEQYRQELSQLSNAFRHLESARPTSFLAEVARRVEFLVQEIRSSLLHGCANPEAYDHAEEASERLRLHLHECLSHMEQSLSFLLQVAG